MWSEAGRRPEADAWLLGQAKEKEALQKSEALAEEGDVDGSMLFANTAEGFKKQWDQLHAQFTQPERTMTVCEVCGVFINSTDNEQRRRVGHPSSPVYLTLTRTGVQAEKKGGPFPRRRHVPRCLCQTMWQGVVGGLLVHLAPFQHLRQKQHHIGINISAFHA